MPRRFPVISAAAFLFFLSIISYNVPTSIFITVDNFSHIYWICNFCGTLVTLLSLAITVKSCASSHGEFVPPNTLSALICILFFVLTAAITIGMFLNTSSTIKMAQSYYKYDGAEIKFKGNKFAILDGKIGRKTLPSIQALVRQKNINFLELQSEGGLIDEAIRLANFLQEKRITAITVTHCKSACVIVAIGARSLYATPNAIFGFHKGSATAAQDSQVGRYAGKIGTDNMVSALRDRGAPETILDQLRRTDPNEMHHLTGEEMYRIGLVKRLIKAD
jgi:ATP-dependent protease ClpP protease subunit